MGTIKDDKSPRQYALVLKDLKKAPGIQLLKSPPALLIIQTVMKWQRDDCLEMGAALSYYAIFSLFPTALVGLSVFGALIGPTSGDSSQIMSASDQMLLFAKSSLPPQAYTLFENTLSNLNRNSLEAGIISFLLLCFTASGVFGALTKSMNTIWQVDKGRRNQQCVKSAAKTFMRNRFWGFVLVFSTSALIFISLVSNILIKVIIDIFQNLESAVGFVQIDHLLLLKTLQVTTSYLLIAGVVMLLFKLLPSTRICWRDVWTGGLFTTGLFMLLQHFASNSIIGVGERFLSYGVVGSVMILMLWIFLTCQAFLLGCEMTYVYAHLLGSRSGVQSQRSDDVQIALKNH